MKSLINTSDVEDRKREISIIKCIELYNELPEDNVLRLITSLIGDGCNIYWALKLSI